MKVLELMTFTAFLKKQKGGEAGLTVKDIAQWLEESDADPGYHQEKIVSEVKREARQ